RELLAAFCRFDGHRPPVHLIMVGEDLMGMEIDNLVFQCGGSKRVIRTGIVLHQEVAYYLSAADVLVLGSYQEGLPNAVVEAMASGVAVVATRVGGIPEIVTDEETGLLVSPKDTDALFAGISRMIENDELRKRCVERGRNLAFARFDAERNAGAFVEILN